MLIYLEKAVNNLKKNCLTTSSIFLHTIASIVFSVGCLMPHTFLPMLYYIFFYSVDRYCAEHGVPSKLRIIFYHENDTLFFLIVSALVLLGILWCYLTYYHRPAKIFIRDYMVLNAHIVARFALITLLFSAIIGFIITNIFLYKFSILQKSPLPKPNYFNPIKLIFKTLKIIPFIGLGVDQMKSFLKAQALFDQINSTSYILYYVAHIISLVQLVWYFFKMKKNLHISNQTE